MHRRRKGRCTERQGESETRIRAPLACPSRRDDPGCTHRRFLSEIDAGEGLPTVRRFSLRREVLTSCWKNIGRGILEVYNFPLFSAACYMQTSQNSQEETFRAYFNVFVHSRFRCIPSRNTLPRPTYRAFWRLLLRACARHFHANSTGCLCHHRLHYHIYHPESQPQRLERGRRVQSLGTSRSCR